MMILDLHAQNNSRFSAHACQRITEFLAELEFSPSICSFCSNWLAIIGNIWFLHSELNVKFWMVGFRFHLLHWHCFSFAFSLKHLLIADYWNKITIKDDVIHKSWYQNILTCTMQYQQTVNKLEGFFKLHKHKYEKGSLMMVALITVVFLLAPGAANCGGGRGWGAGADHNSRPVPAVIGGEVLGGLIMLLGIIKPLCSPNVLCLTLS